MPMLQCFPFCVDVIAILERTGTVQYEEKNNMNEM